jgi:transcriptional regulator with XRE-family HTH domain
MIQSRTLGEAIRDGMKAKGLKQNQVARMLNIDRTTLSKYINGHLTIPDDIKRKLVAYLQNPVLRIKVYGTTSSNIVFDKAQIEFYKTSIKAIEEFEEAIQSIRDVLKFAYNIKSEDEMTDEQKVKFQRMLDEIEDANHVCDMLDIAASDLGADLEERNRRCYQKYLSRGYLSGGIENEAVNI